MSRPGLTFGLALALASAAVPALAQVHPNLERGFVAGKSYNLGQLDTINAMNLGLTLTIPIGPTYSAGGGLEYGLTLSYSNRGWETQAYDDGQGGSFTQATPSPQNNGGFGWMLSLAGRLYANTANDTQRWKWISADGSDHLFYTRLHEDDQEDQEDVALPLANHKVLYTRDATFARLKVISPTVREVEVPDGRIYRFDGSGRLTQIRDRFGNLVTVTYYSNRWEIFDGFRTQKVWLQNRSGFLVVNYVELTAFGGGTAIWDFQYQTPDPMIPFNCFHSPALGTSMTVPLLTAVVLPDGSTYAMPLADYHMAVTPQVCQTGALKGIRTPHGGRIEWSYQQVEFPSQGRPWLTWNDGVATRTLRWADGTVHGTWTYASYLEPGAATQRRELRNTVTDPLGHVQRNYFSVALAAATGGWTPDEYGLPLNRYQPDATGTRFLSVEVLPEGSGSPARSTFVRYERDTLGQAGTLPERQNRNRRVASTRTVFHDDSGAYAEETMSRYDGVGHYREVSQGGSTPWASVSTTKAEYNPGQGIYPGSYLQWPSSQAWVLGTYAFQEASEAGVTARADVCFDPATGFLQRKRVLKAGTAAGANDLLVVYDPYGAGDPNGRPGDVKTERFFGGDAQSLGTGSLCALGLPAEPYWLQHTYQYGSLKTSEFRQAGGGSSVGFKTVDQDIDLRTGLVAARRDTAGVATLFEVDLLGRITAERPGTEAWTSFSYFKAQGVGNAIARIKRFPFGSSNGELTWEEVYLDHFGRVYRELRRMPPLVAGQPDRWAKRTHFYNALGAKTDLSEWEADGVGHTAWTRYRDFDPFGRPTRIVPPDGAAHQIDLSYAGVRVVNRTAKVATGAAGAENAQTTTERYDRHGRLFEVVETSEPILNGSGDVTGHNNVTTTYGYDVGNRLASVSTTSGGTTQVRTFKHDNRGFLQWENHPEKTANVYGSGHDVDYLSYDARGHAGRKVDGANDLRFTYDRAERLTQVADGAGTLLKQWTFGTGTGPGNRSLGKVETAKRHNYPPGFTVILTDTYTYGGLNGRVSARETAITVNGVTNEFWNLGMAYDALGSVSSLTYPDCDFAPACDASPRTVTFGYDEGRLASVPGYATGVTYHLNGMVNQVTHSNGVIDTTTIANAMLRPATMDAKKGATTVWASGGYAYDGAGNVKQVGSGYFQYDPVSRLMAGTVYDGPTGGGTAKTQEYRFDTFGNITRIKTNGTAVQTPTAAATNRLTGGTYDAAGNLTAWNGQLYEYDAFSQMKHFCATTPCPGGAAEDWLYLYNADDERVWSFKWGASPRFERFTLRGLGGEVLREYANFDYTFGTFKDYVYRDGQLLAVVSTAPGEGARHFHLDHLGTPRAITDHPGGTRLAYHAYYPFGQEATVPTQDAERLKFTAHERDLGNPASTADDLDYMHARHCSPLTGRFLSLDRLSGRANQPQSWNRYSYTQGNPMKYLDPDGQGTVIAYEPLVDFEDAAAIREAVKIVLTHTTGPGAAIGADAMLSTFLPASTQEAVDNANASLAGLATPLGTAGGFVGASFGKLGTVLEASAAKITGFTRHGLNRIIQRGVSPGVLKSVVDKPLVVLEQAGGNRLYLTTEGAVVLTRSGRVVTAYTRKEFKELILRVLQAAQKAASNPRK